MKKSEFEALIDRVFRGLEGKYGLGRGEVVFSSDGCTVEFHNSVTVLTLNYKIGSEPWFTIAEAANPQNHTTLEWLLVELGIEKAPVPAQAFNSRRFNEAGLEKLLLQKRQQLLEHATGMLKGDFSLMPRLQAMAAKYDQECRRYLTLHAKK